LSVCQQWANFAALLGDQTLRDPEVGMAIRGVRSSSSRLARGLVAGLLGASVLTAVALPAAEASTLPTGFQDTVVLNGMTNPTALRFASDGRIFVAEKGGKIKVFPGLGTGTTPALFADLGANVHDFWDRGLLGMTLDPSFPTNPYVYVLYTYDARIGGTAGTWGDGCPTPPGATADGCVVSGRLSRLTASGNAMTGSEQVLVNDWCQQYPSHSQGTLLFGRDGALYASAGDGASFNGVDYGQIPATYAGDQANPCGDPPSAAGTALSSPSAQGGALRSQSIRRPSGPASLDGAVLRLNPTTGAGLPDNPFATSSDPNARRIAAYGFRNPFRMTQRPNTDELWIGDVGWNTWEEVDRLVAPTAGNNFGWPCYEGAGPQSGYQGVGLSSCSTLASSAVVAPHYTYNHANCVVAYTGCATGGSSITGIAFHTGAGYGTEYDGALFFGDHSRNEIWAMLPDAAGGTPNPAKLRTVIGHDSTGSGAGHPVDLQAGPNGDIFYVDMEGGTVHRVTYTAANQPPTARISATPTTGSAPLAVSFDGSTSTDPEGRTLAYSWDFDGNGTADLTAAKTTYTYTATGTYRAQLRVTDDQGASSSASVTITVGNTPPVPFIDTPSSSLRWKVGDKISFSGHASDTQEGNLAATALTWTVTLQHCATPTSCHPHEIQSYPGVASGSFTAIDHEYPAYIELKLTATDAGGLTASTTTRLDPQTVALTFKTNPGGLKLATFNSGSQTTPFTVTVIVGSKNSVSAPSPQTLGKNNGYVWQSWSDGLAQAHDIIAPATPTTYTANYKKG
jgi:glucose/arabinose dehydrogenase